MQRILHGNTRRSGFLLFAVKQNAVLQLFNLLFVNRYCKCYLVYLAEMMLGRGYAMGPLPVIGNKNQTGCIKIQSSYTVTAVNSVFLDILKHNRIIGIIIGADTSLGLVDHKVKLIKNLNLKIVELNQISHGNLGCRISYNLAVYQNMSGTNFLADY